MKWPFVSRDRYELDLAAAERRASRLQDDVQRMRELFDRAEARTVEWRGRALKAAETAVAKDAQIAELRRLLEVSQAAVRAHLAAAEIAQGGRQAAEAITNKLLDGLMALKREGMVPPEPAGSIPDVPGLPSPVDHAIQDRAAAGSEQERWLKTYARRRLDGGASEQDVAEEILRGSESEVSELVGGKVFADIGAPATPEKTEVEP